MKLATVADAEARVVAAAIKVARSVGGGEGELEAAVDALLKLREAK